MYRVLIVDDMKSWLTVNSKLIQKVMGDTVHISQANSAKEAYNTIIENINKPFDLILTDLQMESDFEPDTAGEWFVKQVQTLEQYKNIFIIVISAAGNVKDIAEKLNVSYIRQADLMAHPLKLTYLLEEANFILKWE